MILTLDRVYRIDVFIDEPAEPASPGIVMLQYEHRGQGHSHSKGIKITDADADSVSCGWDARHNAFRSSTMLMRYNEEVHDLNTTINFYVSRVSKFLFALRSSATTVAQKLLAKRPEPINLRFKVRRCSAIPGITKRVIS